MRRTFPLALLFACAASEDPAPTSTSSSPEPSSQPSLTPTDDDDDDDGDGDGDGDGATREADCDDADPTRHPLAEEVPYDGIDQDCDGDDLVDQDGDGVAGIAFASWQPTATAAWPSAVSVDAVDCLDDDAIPGVDPASVYPPGEGRPELVDAPYDGVDTDCARDNDFDIDADGYLVSDLQWPSVDADYSAYVGAWGYQAEASGWGPTGQAAPASGDCLDDDPSAHPGAVDLDDDIVDQDCDGWLATEGFAFAMDDGTPLAWHRPTELQAESLNKSALFYTHAEALAVGDEPPGGEGTFELFAERVVVQPSMDVVEEWKRSSWSESFANPNTDTTQRDDCSEVAHVVTSSKEVYDGVVYLVNQEFVGKTLWPQRHELLASTSFVEEYEGQFGASDVEVLQDEYCNLFLIACSGGKQPQLTVVHASPASGAGVQTSNAIGVGLGGGSCFPMEPVTAGTLTVRSCRSAGGCFDVVFERPTALDPLTLTSTTELPDLHVREGGFREGPTGAHHVGWELPGEGLGMTVRFDGLPHTVHPGEYVVTADAVILGDEVVVAAIVADGAAPLRLTFLDGGITREVALPVNLPEGVELADVSVADLENRLGIGITGHHLLSTAEVPRDVVGWMWPMRP